MEKWPNFFIVGAPKSGTTTLYDLLKRTDGVFMSKKKEPHFFSKSIDPSDDRIMIRDKKKYLNLFKDVKDEKAIGESSGSYLWDPLAPKLIHQQIPHAKIVMILRDPVQRCYSNYYWRIGSGRISSSFTKAIKKSLEYPDDFFKGVIINGSWYYEQVKRYIDTFGKNKVKVLIFEEFIKDPRKTVNEVLDFLGVNSEPAKVINLPHNILSKPRGKVAKSLLESKTVKKIGRKFLSDRTQEIIVRKILGEKTTKAKMSNNDKIFLENLFRKDVQKLQKLLNIKLPGGWVC